MGDVATVSESFPSDPSYTINWYRDNFAAVGVTNDVSFTTYVPGDYKAVLVYNTQNSDGSFCQQISASNSLVFNPLPTVSIQQTVNTTLCAGQTVSLAANHSSGTVQWATGETTDQITVTQTGTYKVTVTSPAGCQADTSISVTFLPDPVFSLRDTSICTYKKQVITLTAPPGFAAYSWNNGASTSETYPVTQPQTVSLTVTDANGCQATQQIKVADECPVVFIPNTFTPNGDGINDTWVIEGLDETGTVKVFSRWGAEVYQSVGYSTPWNGEYGGKKLASGVYYYIVTAKGGTQKFSGSLTIIY
jgi:gliding motility-associated-like protein